MANTNIKYQKTIAVMFTSIKISKNSKFQKKRILQYQTGVNSIVRNLPENVTKILIDNTGYFESNKNLILSIFKKSKNFYVLSYNFNSGSSNKGIGELQMLEDFVNIIDINSFDRVLYLTGRYFHTQPYMFLNAINSRADFVYCKPKFYGLDGEELFDGSVNALNDMFFCSTPEFIYEYVNYFRKRKSEMVERFIPSETLLWDFFKIKAEEESFISEQFPSIGAVRLTSRKEFRIDDIQII